MSTDSITMDPSSPQARAQRLLWVRHMVNLPRQTFSDYPGLNPDCIYRWEKVKRGGLTRKGAHKIVERLAQLGVACSVQWLLEGIGQAPVVQPAVSIDVEPLMGNAEEYQIAEELEAFRRNAHAIEWFVPDDAMAPEYCKGDYVAGVQVPDIIEGLGLACIVQTKKGERLLRKVEVGTDIGRYALLCTNPSQGRPVIQHDVELHSVAPILWRRRTWTAMRKAECLMHVEKS
jgi:hypothetical protein